MEMELYSLGGAFAIELLPPSCKQEIFWCRVKVFNLGITKSEGNLSSCGLSCEGFEEEMMALLNAIEASHFQKESA
jgi:hypothetical protein